MFHDKIYHVPYWLNRLLDAVLPPKKEVLIARSLHEEELAALLRPRLVHEAWLMALFPYSEARIRALICSVKFYGERSPLSPLAGSVCGYIAEVVGDRMHGAGWNVPLLVPMPASLKRIRERGYNQVERIASALADELQEVVVYAPNILSREDRESQVRVPRDKRALNIYGAFFVKNPHALAGKQVLLIDDVVESGSTMRDARRALLAAGVTDVIGIAVAS